MLLKKKEFFGVFVLGFCLLVLEGFSSQVPKKEVKHDFSSLIGGLKFRNIGPAVMGGRTVDFAVVESNTAIIYAAVGPSGVWKSENGGITWQPVFDKEGSVAVGAVAVSQSHPDIVWVGTGEGTARNSVGIGDGVYKSEDGGKTWKKMGLEDTRFISKIIIDRTNPDTVYVGALGHLWGPNKERGLFKTENGGKTWKKVLYINEDTGIADLAIDPSNSKILYVAAWDYRRLPYHFRSGGPGSGLYKSTDGGETWKRLTKGLPEGDYGRIGIDVCRSNPDVVYAVIEAKDSGVFRSEDKGETWTRMCDKRTYDRINFRPFYYSKITVDPNNDLVVYVYSGSSYVSRDGGKTYEAISGDTHPDHHTLWVNPHNSNHLIDGNDGGIDISYDGGKTWYDVKSAAWAEVYQVGFDMRDPYYVYVGLQDNGSWGGPVNSLDPNGIMNYHWYPIGGGDGFYIQVDPEEPYVLYRNAHMGGISRFHVNTGDSQGIKPIASLKDEPYRFNWNSPILLSPHNRNVLYFGGNYLFKSIDKGRSWQKVSPDLSTNDPEKQKDSGGITPDNTGAEIHCTIFTISESPLQEGLIWVGTDDGLVQLTRDGGKTWENVTKNIKGLPPESWVTRIEASHFAPGTAYATFSRHQVDDYRPYIYKTEDFGKTWISLKANLPDVGYLHVVREDPQNKDLLFVGSEFGLFLSFDGGKSWISWRHDFPTIAVRDIQIHPRERDLLVGTHGRGIWILDDLKPLESLTPEVLERESFLFEIRPATLFSLKSSSMYSGPHDFSGPNPPYGACINYYLKNKPKEADRISLTIQDLNGNLVRTLKVSREKGINRVYWDLREEGLAMPPSEIDRGRRFGGMMAGAFVFPGEYRVVLEFNDQKTEKKVLVKPFQEHKFTLEERRLNQKYVREIGELVLKGDSLIRSMNSLQDQLENLERRIKAEKISAPSLIEKLNALKAKVNGVLEVYSYSPEGASGYRRPVKVALRGGMLPEQLSGLRGAISSWQGAPTQTQIDQFEEIKGILIPLLEREKEIRARDIPELNRMLNENGFPFLKI